MIELRNNIRDNERGRTFAVQYYRFALIGLLGFCMACSGSVPDDIIQEEAPTGIIFVKATRSSTLNHFSRGGNLFSLIPASPDGKLTNLTNLEAGDVSDPEISYDGLKVLFAMRQNSGDSFNIYEMQVDGTGLNQITNSQFDDHDPIYLPNGKILFTSNRPGFTDEYNRQDAEVMHTMDKDGSNIECVSFNQSDDFDPIVIADGRVVYTRWEHHGPINRFPLFFTNPDGHGTFTFFSPHRMRTFFHPREMADGSIIAIHSGMVNGDRGQVVRIKDHSTAGEPRRDGDIEILTPDVETSGPPYEKGVFKYPHPLPDGRIMVSFSPRFGRFEDSNGNVVEDIEPDYGLYTMQANGGDLRLLYNDPDFEEFDAVVIGERPIPPVLASVLDKSQDTGTITVVDAYFRQTGDGQVVPDKSTQEIKKVMVIEGIPRARGNRASIGMTNFEQKRIIGTAPVQPDGSFSIRVPTNIPLSFNTLDEFGRALIVKRNWVTMRPGEIIEGCPGCHGPRGSRSEINNPISATLPPTDLNIPVAQREDVSFGVALEPIVEAKCAVAGCHIGDTPADSLDLALTKSIEEPLFSNAYVNLMEGSELVREPFSRRSRLIDKLMGMEPFQGAGRHPSGVNALTDDELRKFINWIDLGGQYR